MALPLGIPFLCCRRESNPPLCFGAPPQRTGLLYWPPLCRRATLFPAAWNIFDKLLPLSCGSLWLCLSASPSCAAGGSRTRTGMPIIVNRDMLLFLLSYCSCSGRHALAGALNQYYRLLPRSCGSLRLCLSASPYLGHFVKWRFISFYYGVKHPEFAPLTLFSYLWARFHLEYAAKIVRKCE